MDKIDFYGTFGPSCMEEETIKALFLVGMTGIRLNLSHSNLVDCGEWIRNLRNAAHQVGLNPKLLIDLKGPELRVGDLKEAYEMKKGQEVVFGPAGIPLPDILWEGTKEGQELLLDDGSISVQIQRISQEPKSIWGIVTRGGTLLSRKSVAVAGVTFPNPTLTESDQRNIEQAAKYGVTGIMLPFVRNKEDLLCLREALDKTGAKQIKIFAKLENSIGVDNLPELLPYADEIVIARGDLGNAVSLTKLPVIQKKIAAICRKNHTPFMVVTQMLHSMIKNETPTRAEVSDIGNAIWDGASSLMLTGETAIGDHPVKAMEYLVNTATEADKVRSFL